MATSHTRARRDRRSTMIPRGLSLSSEAPQGVSGRHRRSARAATRAPPPCHREDNAAYGCAGRWSSLRSEMICGKCAYGRGGYYPAPCDEGRVYERETGARTVLQTAGDQQSKLLDVPPRAGCLEHHARQDRIAVCVDGRHASDLQPARCRQSRRGSLDRRGAPGGLQHDVDSRRVPPRRRAPRRAEWDVVDDDDPHGLRTRIGSCSGAG